MPQQNWKDIEGYDGEYKISNKGTVKRMSTKTILTFLIKDGFYRVELKDKYKKKKQVYVHRLVAEYFVNNPNKLPVIFHIDRNKFNNNSDNLKWIDRKEMVNYYNQQKIINFDISQITNENELWEHIKDFSKYMISNQGRAVSKVTSTVLEPTITNGYYSVGLYQDNAENEQKQFKIHRLVANAFIPKTDPTKNTIDHINNNKLDNRSVNLQWVTIKENNQNFIDNHKIIKAESVLQYDKDMNFIKEWSSVKEIVTQNTNYKNKQLYACLNERCKSIYGSIWRYKNKIKTNIILQKDEEFRNIGMLDDRNFGNYELSNYGNIKGLYQDKYLIPQLQNDGYYSIGLYDKDTHKGYNIKIHILVAKVFIGTKPDSKYVVNHIDEDKTNNYYKNLEWKTQQKNVEYSLAKQINQIDSETDKIIKTFNSIVEACNYLNISNSGRISKCCNGKAKTAGGYKWSYAT